ncbi:hypothetical protein CC2G_012839 [Coprinopsis cinerea AmutBmut pab1-1]|nr:hypothetical protein CC2G_012839 [Coprinopsis cinerea AmutBmut pab1-1]
MSASEVPTAVDSSPLQSIPIEILRQVFVAGYPVIDIRRPESFVGRLSAVCFQWRSAIINTPELWSDIDLSFDSSIEQMHSSSASNHLPKSVNLLVDLILQRSKRYPLSIRFEPTACFASIASVMARLLAHSKRWIRASFNCQIITTYYGGFPLSQSFNNLQSLTLEGPGRFTMLCKPPKLRKLTITSFQMVTPSDLNVPWDRLASLTISISDALIHYLPSLWRATTQLDALDITLLALQGGRRPASASFSGAHQVDLPALSTFKLVSTLDQSANILLQTIKARNLNILSLCNAPGPPSVSRRRSHNLRSEDLKCVSNFLGRSDCQLQQFQIFGFDKTTSYSILALEGIKTVNRIHLSGIWGSEELLRDLSRYSLEANIVDMLPNLEHITLSHMDWVEMDSLVETVVKFLCSRLYVSNPYPDKDSKTCGYRYLKQATISDTWMVRRIVSRLQEELPPWSFSWDFHAFDWGKPVLVSVKFHDSPR